MSLIKTTGCSPLFVRQKLAAHGDFDPITFGIFNFVDIEREIDRAHDAITKMLLDDILQRHAIDLHDLVEAIDQGIGGDHRITTSLGGELLQSRSNGRIKGEKRSQLVSLFLGSRGLTLEQ